MPFENFYKESDQAARRWWKFVGLAFLIFIGYWIFGFLFFSRFDNQDKPIKTTPTSERRQHLIELCGNLPKPERFYPMKSDAPKTYSTATAVFYSYRSDRSFDEVSPLFLIYFDSNGWQRASSGKLDKQIAPDRELIFSKGKQTISISYEEFEIPEDFTLPVANYEIYCYEED